MTESENQSIGLGKEQSREQDDRWPRGRGRDPAPADVGAGALSGRDNGKLPAVESMANPSMAMVLDVETSVEFITLVLHSSKPEAS